MEFVSFGHGRRGTASIVFWGAGVVRCRFWSFIAYHCDGKHQSHQTRLGAIKWFDAEKRDAWAWSRNKYPDDSDPEEGMRVSYELG
jgi:hypothetical protein